MARNHPDGHLAELADALRARIGPGCLIHQVGRSSELLASLESRLKYHLVILDLGPDNDPASLREALGGLRKKHRQLPIIVAAEVGDVDVVNALLAAGASDVLTLGNRLEARVETLMGRLNNLVQALWEKTTWKKKTGVSPAESRSVTKSSANLRRFFP